jgi:hypothetical protein
MTEREILDRIIGSSTTIGDVVAAFSGTHPEVASYSWRATAKIRGEIIAIEGSIFGGDQEIGHFSRRLFYEGGEGQAIHEIMEIERPHRDHDIAKYHYTSVLRFYDRVGIRYVSMEAESEGPVIWSTFGFDFSRSQHREMLLKILREWEVNPLPAPASILAPQVVSIGTEDSPMLGAEAIEELAMRADEPLPMRLDLLNETQRVYLRSRGIL